MWFGSLGVFKGKTSIHIKFYNYASLKLCNIQVVANVDDCNPLDKQTEAREDGLDNDVAAHINSKMADLSFSFTEKQVHFFRRVTYRCGYII